MIENGSAKHSPRRDDAMAAETKSMVRAGHSTRAEEWRDPEPSAEGEPATEPVHPGDSQEGTQPGMTPEDVERRAEIARYIGRLHSPADRGTLIRVAQGNQAPDEVIARLSGLPEGEEYANVQQVVHALGFGTESYRT